MPRWQIVCDGCDFAAWIGEHDGRLDGWCEACQESANLPIGAGETPCARCGRALTLGEPRFEEIFGEMHHLAAVLAAWDGDAAPLSELLPERPRYRSDLDPPPVAEGDSEAVQAALLALAAGSFARARESLEPLAATTDDARLWRALAIACERRGDLDAAELALRRAERQDRSPLVALERGALLARRGDLQAAAELFDRAGNHPEAGWNRAAVQLALAVEARADVPERSVLDRARGDAGPPSSYWSDHTVGRLLWGLLIERLPNWAVRPMADVLEGAEREFEFDTFWDRALKIEGYVRLGLSAKAAPIAAALAGELVVRLAAEPAIAGTAASAIAAVFEAARYAIERGRPGEACEAIGGLLRRPDLSHYRIPCRRCGTGSIGVAELEDSA